MCGGSKVGAAGKDVGVARRVVVAAVMVLVVCLLFWAGWHNLRSRRLAMQQAQQAQVTVQKDSSDAGAGYGDYDQSDWQGCSWVFAGRLERQEGVAGGLSRASRWW